MRHSASSWFRNCLHTYHSNSWQTPTQPLLPQEDSLSTEYLYAVQGCCLSINWTLPNKSSHLYLLSTASQKTPFTVLPLLQVWLTTVTAQQWLLFRELLASNSWSHTCLVVAQHWVHTLICHNINSAKNSVSVINHYHYHENAYLEKLSEICTLNSF